MIIPNVMDFDSPPAPLDEYARSARADLGLAPGQYLILQPTRIIQRKGIEHAIELTRRLGLPARLVISHAAGDEGTDYEKRVREFAALLNVTVNFESAIVGDARGVTPEGRKIYTLGDVYPQADLVTYPSSIEGFGNAFLEAIYYKRPLVVNNYSIYETDIKPKGFKVVEFDGYINDATLGTCAPSALASRGRRTVCRTKLQTGSPLLLVQHAGAPPPAFVGRLLWRSDLKIALLHYSSPPIVGGVESVLAHHARLMAKAGHEVTIFAGRGKTFDERIPVRILPRLDSRHAEVLAVKRELDRGQVHARF